MGAMANRDNRPWAKRVGSPLSARGCAFWRADSGASLLELALITPLLLSLLIGVIEFGRYAYYSILVANAARAGAQYGAQNVATAADTPGIINAASNDGQNLAALTINAVQECGCTGSALSSPCPVTGATGCASPGHPLVYVQVTVSATINSMFNYPGIPRSLPLTSTVTMRVGQ
jgi:Flp pilus assembly protein TadG